MTYKTPQPPITVFSDPQQQNLVRRLYERLHDLEQVTQSQSVSAGRKSPAPPTAKLNVSVNASVKGFAYVRIVNPEFLLSRRNPVRSPIRHWLQASPDPAFRSNVTDFGISHSTYIPVAELGSGVFHFQIRSTYDGQTFNDPVTSGKVQIP